MCAAENAAGQGVKRPRTKNVSSTWQYTVCAISALFPKHATQADPAWPHPCVPYSLRLQLARAASTNPIHFSSVSGLPTGLPHVFFRGLPTDLLGLPFPCVYHFHAAMMQHDVLRTTLPLPAHQVIGLQRTCRRAQHLIGNGAEYSTVLLHLASVSIGD